MVFIWKRTDYFKLYFLLLQVEEDAREEIEAWEKENGRVFLLEGVPFVHYIQRQWELFREQKENEKQERVS